MSAPACVLADEHTLFRTALGVALEADGGYRVVAQVDDVDHARAAVARWRPDVVIASSTLPGGGPAALCAGSPFPAPVLVLSEVSDHSMLLAALEAGAQGYAGKDGDLSSLTTAVASLLRGEATVPPAMLAGLLHELVVQRRDGGRSRDKLDCLSRREREVLELLVEGMGQEGIAARLVISPQTARTHIQNVIGKLGVHSRLEAVAVALESGLVAAS